MTPNPKRKRPTRIEKSFVMPNSSKYGFIEIYKDAKAKCIITYSPKKGTVPRYVYETVYRIMVVGKVFRSCIDISELQYKALIKGAGKPVIKNKAMTKHIIYPYKQK